MYSDEFFNASFYEQMFFFFNLCGKERHRQGITQEFNLGVGSHVSITVIFAGEWGRGAWGGLQALDNSVSLT